MKKRRRKKKLNKPTVVKLKDGSEILVIKTGDGRLIVFSDEVHFTKEGGLSFEAQT